MVMEATSISVGRSVVNGVISYAKSVVGEEVALQLGVQHDQAFITDELEMMQAFLMTAHEERDDNKIVKIWVKQVRDVAYDVEDCLQDFAVRLDQQPWWRFAFKLLDRRRVAKEMKELRAKVEDISQRNVRYRLVRDAGPKPTATAEQCTISTEVQLQIAEATRTALQEKKKVKLAELITEDENDLRVIAVWGGSSEIGVASIITAAYDDQDVKAKFQCRAWIRLTHPFNPNDLFVSLVRQFYEDSCEETGKATEGAATGVEVMKKMAAQDNLVDEFNRYVTEKRCLVVINDVSTIEEWNWIKTYFPNKKGSKIIVSTQHFEVASLCTEQPYMVSEMEQNWSFDKEFYVFYKKVDSPTKKQGKAGSSLTEPAGQEHIKKPNAASAMDDELIDRTAAKAKVMKLIIQGGEVITIWGMGGLGKTTLVRSVYQHEHGDSFQRRAWLTVSRSFSDKEFLGDLLRQLNHEDKREASNPDIDELHSQSDINPVTKLAKILLEHKCLIVFDDLSSIGEWLWIMKLLPTSRNNGSRIIVTTRELNVAKCCSMEEENIYNLELLNEEDAHQLFKKRVFKDAEGKNDCSRSPEMIEQENLILKKCGGLPLAISTVGSFLASKPKTAVEWRNLNKHINAELEINPELGMIKTVLTSSYDGLPYYLKSCFLYLAIFSEDQEIRWKRLVRRWIAESYARGVRNMTAEEIGNSYITQLISRSMVQQSKLAARKTERIAFLQLHDLIREIGISQAAEENLIITLEANCNINTQGRFRHLTVSNSWARDKDAFESAIDFSHLRSLTVFGFWESFFISDKMRLLRVLDLEDTEGITDHHLHQICQLFHLNYLSLRKCVGILRLPNSLGNLKHLQTLDIRDTKIIKMPRTIIKLRKLQYLRVGLVPGDEDHQEREQWVYAILKYYSYTVMLCMCPYRRLLSYCWVPRSNRSSRAFCCFARILFIVTLNFLLRYLVWLLLYMGFGQLLLLAHCSWIIVKDGFHGLPVFFFKLNPYGVNFPTGIRQLKSLHTLGVVNIDRGDAIFEDLQHLTELRKLRVNGLNKNNCEKFLSAIGKHKCLESLLIRSEGTPGLAGCFDGMSPRGLSNGSPNHQNLRSLKLYGNLVSLPKWIERLQNLVKLELRSSNISKHDEAIEFLGNLPNLAILRLLSGSFSGYRLSLGFHHGAFPRLVLLELSLLAIKQLVTVKSRFCGPRYIRLETKNIGTVKRVIFEEGAAPRLEVLMFLGSSTKVGCFSGLQCLTSLKEFMLHNDNYSRDFVADLRSQLAGNPSGPILNMYNYDYDNTTKIVKHDRTPIRVIKRILQFIGLGPTR